MDIVFILVKAPGALQFRSSKNDILINVDNFNIHHLFIIPLLESKPISMLAIQTVLYRE